MVANENFFTRGYAQGDFAKLVEKDLEKELLSSPSETDRDRKVVEYGKRMADLVKDVQDLQISHKLLEGRTTEIEKRQDKYERENDEEHKEFREMKTSMAVVISKQDDMAEDVKTIKKATTGSSAFVETLYKQPFFLLQIR